MGWDGTCGFFRFRFRFFASFVSLVQVVDYLSIMVYDSLCVDFEFLMNFECWLVWSMIILLS